MKSYKYQKKKKRAVTGTCLSSLQKPVEASLHASSARSEPLLANCEKLQSKKDPATYGPYRQLRRPGGGRRRWAAFLYGYTHSVEDGTLDSRLPSSSPSRCQRRRYFPLLSGDDSPNLCSSEVDFRARATSSTRHRHGSRSKQSSHERTVPSSRSSLSVVGMGSIHGRP
ncbi:hypothetical protein ISCGN_025704 [Ixodes scapularis]